MSTDPTPEMVKHERLSAAIGAVMGEVGYVENTGENKFHRYSYAKDSDLIRALRPSMLKHGVVGPLPVKTTQSREEAAPTKRGARQWVTTVDVEYILLHRDSGDRIELAMSGAGIDGEDKGTFKAMTGAYKYILREGFMIETGDDPEEDHQPQPQGGGASEEDLESARSEGAQKGREWVIRQIYSKADRDESFDGRTFASKLKKAGIGSMDDVRHFCFWKGARKPSQRNQEEREKLIEWLGGANGQKAFAEFVEVCGIAG